MTLLANAGASSRLEFRRVNNAAGAGVGKVLLRWAVAAFASDCFFGKSRRTILVQGAWDMKRCARMAKHTFFANRPSEIGVTLLLKSRGQAVCVPAPIVSHRRLEQISANVHQIAAGVVARTDNVVDTVLGSFSSILPTLPVSRG